MEGHQKDHPEDPPSLNRLAFTATAHCLAGCSIGEVLGMIAGSAFRWGTGPTLAVSVVLAFIFGYAFTVVPLYRSGIPLAATLRLALAADTFSIIIMEIVDNGIMLIIPGAMNAGLEQILFWASLAGSLVLAGMAAFPVNRWLIARGRGHAVVHGLHASPGDASSRRRIPHQDHHD
jgi:phage shock protein PspC (stress-responsive transcriptional regulator)